MTDERDATSGTGPLWLILAANLALVAALIAVGITAHSVGVFAEGADYLADAAAIGVSLLAIHLAARPADPQHPSRYRRAPDYAALINAGWLLILSLLVAAAALTRLLTGTHHVHGLPVLVVSGVAALVMLASALLLADDINDAQDLNRRAVLLDTAADAAAAAGVAVTGAIIYATHGQYWLDSAVALLISGIVSWYSIRLLISIRAALRQPSRPPLDSPSLG